MLRRLPSSFRAANNMACSVEQSCITANIVPIFIWRGI